VDLQQRTTFNDEAAGDILLKPFFQRPLVRRAAREIHFASSLSVVVLLVFFACTGFMAEHREWFHDRVERSDIAAPIALDTSCDRPALIHVLGGGTEAPAPDGWLAAQADDGRRLMCRNNDTRAYLGRAHAVPAGVVTDETSLREHFYVTLGGRKEVGGPGDALPPSVWRWSTVWGTQSVFVDPDRRSYGLWRHDYPIAFALIGIHRGRGSTERLLDVTVFLVLLTAVSGVVHGLRVPGQRTRWLLGLLVIGVVLAGVLVLGS
jgi:hypothetical protein